MMSIQLRLLFAIPAILAACDRGADQPEQTRDLPETYAKTIENAIGFFDKHAWDPEQQVYYSEVDNQGNVVSDKIFTVALSRHVYGLSYTSAYYPDHLDKARKLIEFQLDHLIGEHSTGPYFLSYVEGEYRDTSKELDIWQQAYGLCGLSEYYRRKPGKALLNDIHSFHDAFISRFRDEQIGGFWGNYTLNSGPVAGSKSLQTLMYPVTAYMANLWKADSAHRQLYEPYLEENLEILYQVAWNDQSGWVNLKFDDDWNPCESGTDPSCPPVTPGHNFQLAATMLRTESFGFLPEDTRTKYVRRGKEIIRAMMEKGFYGNDSIQNGFYNSVNPVTSEITNSRKAWWQHCEALVALSLVRDTHAEELKSLENFFFEHFPDFENGGTFFFLDKNNQPVTDVLKGSKGKATYHTTEMIRFLMGD